MKSSSGINLRVIASVSGTLNLQTTTSLGKRFSKRSRTVIEAGTGVPGKKINAYMNRVPKNALTGVFCLQTTFQVVIGPL